MVKYMIFCQKFHILLWCNRNLKKRKPVDCKWRENSKNAHIFEFWCFFRCENLNTIFELCHFFGFLGISQKTWCKVIVKSYPRKIALILLYRYKLSVSAEPCIWLWKSCSNVTGTDIFSILNFIIFSVFCSFCQTFAQMS